MDSASPPTIAGGPLDPPPAGRGTRHATMSYADELLAAADRGYLALPPWPEWDTNWTLRLGRPVTDAYVAWQELCQRFAAAEAALTRPVDLQDAAAIAAARRLREDLAAAFEGFAQAQAERQAAVADGASAGAIASRPHRAAWFAYWRDLSDLAGAVAAQLRDQIEHLDQAAPQPADGRLPPWPPTSGHGGQPGRGGTAWFILAAVLVLAAASQRDRT